MNIKPEISVIIPSLNRPESLYKTVLQLLKSDFENFECIVVDQSVDSVGRNKLTDLSDARLHIEILEHPSLPAARNRGVALSKSNIVLFLDDDVEFDIYFLAAHLRAHLNNPTVAAITGRIKLASPHQYSQNAVLAAIDKKTAEFIVNFDNDVYQETAFISGGNVSVKKYVFERVGFFDELYRGNAFYEEIDFSMRMQKAKLSILFVPEAAITHLRADSGGCRNDSARKWAADKFFNTGLFYGRWLFHGNPLPFINRMKKEMEFFSRKGGGHSLIVLVNFSLFLLIGFFIGIYTSKLYCDRKQKM